MRKSKKYNVSFTRVQTAGIEVTIVSTGDSEQDIEKAFEEAQDKILSMSEQQIKEKFEDGEWEQGEWEADEELDGVEELQDDD
jgi:hypothetical protein